MPTWARFAIFFTVFFSVLGSGHFFLYRRLVRALTDDPKLRRAGRWALGSLFGTLILSGPIGWIFRNPLSEAISAVGWTWLGVAWYLGLVTAVLGLLGWIG